MKQGHLFQVPYVHYPVCESWNRSCAALSAPLDSKASLLLKTSCFNCCFLLLFVDFWVIFLFFRASPQLFLVRTSLLRCLEKEVGVIKSNISDMAS